MHPRAYEIHVMQSSLERSQSTSSSAAASIMPMEVNSAGGSGQGLQGRQSAALDKIGVQEAWASGLSRSVKPRVQAQDAAAEVGDIGSCHFGRWTDSTPRCLCLTAGCSKPPSCGLTSVLPGIGGAAAGAHLVHLLRQPLVFLHE